MWDVSPILVPRIVVLEISTTKDNEIGEVDKQISVESAIPKIIIFIFLQVKRDIKVSYNR